MTKWSLKLGWPNYFALVSCDAPIGRDSADVVLSDRIAVRSTTSSLGREPSVEPSEVRAIARTLHITTHMAGKHLDGLPRKMNAAVRDDILGVHDLRALLLRQDQPVVQIYQ